MISSMPPRPRRPGNWTALGQAVRDARVRAGRRSGTTFAQSIGVSPSTVYNIETGRPIAESSIIGITDALGWPPNRWREILHGAADDAGETPSADVVVSVPEEEWEPLSEDDRRYVLDLVRRLADGKDA